jgi:hypothetical protein
MVESGLKLQKEYKLKIFNVYYLTIFILRIDIIKLNYK